MISSEVLLLSIVFFCLLVLGLGWHVLSASVVSFPLRCRFAVRWISAIGSIFVLLRFLLSFCSSLGWECDVAVGVIVFPVLALCYPVGGSCSLLRLVLLLRWYHLLSLRPLLFLFLLAACL